MMSVKLSLPVQSPQAQKAPRHMLPTKAWAEKEGISERAACRLLTELCQNGSFQAAKYAVPMFGGGTRQVLHYGPRK
jgi:hypothetical protein